MNSKLTCFDRMAILSILLKRKESTVAELANTFSVCRKTAYNDIVYLSRYAPMYTRSGNNGGVFLLSSLQNDFAVYLSEKEESLLQSMMAVLDGESKVIVGSILMKFSMPKSVHSISARRYNR